MKSYYDQEQDQDCPINEIRALVKNDNIHLIREKGSIRANMLYCEMCYPVMVGKQKWKIRHTDCTLRSLVTEADEALAAVILENNFEEWDMLSRGNELDKDNRKTKYTHGGKDNSEGTRKGWSLEGKQRYNDMFDAISRLRQDQNYGEKLEYEMNQKWKETSRANKRKQTDDMDTEEEERRKEKEENFKPRFSAF